LLILRLRVSNTFRKLLQQIHGDILEMPREVNSRPELPCSEAVNEKLLDHALYRGDHICHRGDFVFLNDNPGCWLSRIMNIWDLRHKKCSSWDEWIRARLGYQGTHGFMGGNGGLTQQLRPYLGHLRLMA